jgi:hypothetical protein
MFFYIWNYNWYFIMFIYNLFNYKFY